VPCSKQNESTLRGVTGAVGFLGLSGSVPRSSRRAYSCTRSPVSAPAPVPEPVGAGACSRRHVPCHLENEQVEREQQLCTRALSQAAWCSWVSLAQYPVRERGGSDEPACSTSSTSTSRGPGELLVPHLLLSRKPVENRAGKSKRHCSGSLSGTEATGPLEAE
jgi:hypothetical protein